MKILLMTHTSQNDSNKHKQYKLHLTLNLLNFLNGIIHLNFFVLFIIIFRDIKMYQAWSDCSILVAKANQRIRVEENEVFAGQCLFLSKFLNKIG